MSNLSKMTHNHHEQGAALIAVLLILILVLVVGVVALRKSTTDLRIATADQMDNVLLQSSESANQKLESIVNGNTTNALYRNVVLGSTGALGYFISKPTNRGDEFVYCFNPRTNDYMLNTATVHRGTGLVVNNRGFCSNDNGESFRYTSDREVVATQVNLTLPKKSDDSDVAPFDGVNYGGNPEKSNSYAFDMYTTSVMPAYGDTGDCLSRRTTDLPTNQQSLVDCLASRSLPHKVIYQEILLSQSYTLGR